MISRQASALTIFHMLELLETQGAYTLRAFMERMLDEGARDEEGMQQKKKKGHSSLAKDAAL